MSTGRVLLVGESWTSSAVHHKGFDSFGSTTFHNGAQPLIDALAGSRFELEQMPAHDAVEEFPFDRDGLSSYDAIILSDIGANSFLLPAEVWLHGRPRPNRLKLIRDWVADGGGLVMVGGYMSFQGIDGKARWRNTPVEQTLPVSCHTYDDRVEVPDGFSPVVTIADHPILNGISGDWPRLFGANEVMLKDEVGITLLARMPDEEGGHPLLASRVFGGGRTVAWMSDLSPHRLPSSFSDWPGYGRLWENTLLWVTRGV